MSFHEVKCSKNCSLKKLDLWQIKIKRILKFCKYHSLSTWDVNSHPELQELMVPNK